LRFKIQIEKAFTNLAEAGIGVVDVGSRSGVHPVFREVASLVDAVGFEPDVEECERLNEASRLTQGYRSLTFLPFGLGSADGEATLHLCRARGTSSLYTVNRPFVDRFPDASRFDVQAERCIPIRSLDGVVGDPAIGSPKWIDFVKVDTQGSELDILLGARKTLGSQVVAVEVEVEFARLYESQPVFRDVDAFMVECGFTLFKLRRQEWVKRCFETRPEWTAGQLVFGDVLYLRDPLSREARWNPQNSRQAEVLVLMAILYDLHDFAWEVVSDGEIGRMVNADMIKRYIHGRSRKLGRQWTGGRIVMDLLRSVRAGVRAMHRFKRYDRGWGRGDSNFYSRI
jgi:FkbM family methyltransferase